MKEKNNEKEYWKDISNIKKGYSSFFSDKQKKILVDLFLKYKKKEKDSYLLEAGSGWGYYVKAFSHYNKKVIGLDFEKK